MTVVVLYLVAANLQANFGGLGSHGLSGAQSPLCGTQPLSQRLH